MKQLMAIGVAVALTAGASAQDAVQWRVEDGGNGHWYALMRVPQAWQQARKWCDDHGGHLATVTSLNESALIASLSLSSHTWLGGFQDAQSSDFSEPAGGWRWITGESWTVSVWNSAEPNNYPPGQENWLATHNNLQTWADLPGDWTLPFIIEFDADCNSDGLVDYGQIRAGQLPDANCNNIPDCCENGGSCCPGDTNNDQSVDGIDLATILTRWGMPGAKFPQADCNDDGAIDGTDLAIVLAGWGGCV